MNLPVKISTILTALAALPISAELLIYEPFDYPDTGPINDLSYFGDGTQSGALGTTGAWSELANSDNPDGSPVNGIDVRAVGLTFTDGGGNELPVSGGHITRDNRVGQSSAAISVDPSAKTALTADNTTIWMTLLFQDRGFSGPDSGIALATDTMVASDSQALNSAGFGVGIGVNGVGGQERALGTIVFNDATGQTFTPEPGPAPYSFNGPGASDVVLLAMKVNWNEFGTPDEIFVFNITDLTTEPDESAALASDTFDWTQEQQNSLGLLSIGDSQVERFDEIRIATTFLEAVGAELPAENPFSLTITPSVGTPGNYDFSWDSQDGKLYDLVSATNLSAAPDTWAIWEGQTDVVATPPTNTLTDVNGSGDPRRFFAVMERDAPPPPPLLSEDFEGGATPAGWTASGTGTTWSVGTPNGDGSSNTEPSAAAGGTFCAGTNMNAKYDNSADARLVTPAFTVPAGGATLELDYYIDTEAASGGADFGIIRLLNAADDTPLTDGEVAPDLQGTSLSWNLGESLALPAAANGLEVKLEFGFVSDDAGENWAGFYIDNLVVTEN